MQFDFEGFYMMLDRTREARRLNWKQVSEQTGVHRSTLSRFGHSRQIDINNLVALSKWAAVKIDDFVCGDNVTLPRAETLAVVSIALRSDPRLSTDAALLLDSVVQTMYGQLNRSHDG